LYPFQDATDLSGKSWRDVPVYKSFVDIICTRVEYGSTIFTDEYIGYMTNWKNMVLYTKSAIHSQKEYANDIIHINNCECRSNYQLLDKLSLVKDYG
jgi:hypothetical protein